MDEVSVSWKGRLIALAIGLFLLLGISEIAVRIIFPQWSEFYSGRFLTVETVPGFGRVAIGRSGFDGYFSQNNGDFRSHIKINAHGLRNDQPVESANNSIWVIGDSMAFGWGVDDSEMYSSVLGKLSSRASYNVASPGTNVCGYQALSARMPQDVRPSAVVVGLILENDLRVYDCAKEANAVVSEPQSNLNLSSLKVSMTNHSAMYNFFAVSVKRINILREALIWTGLISKSHAYRNQLSDRDVDAVISSTVDELNNLRAMFPSNIPFVVLIAPSRFEIAHNDEQFIQIREKMIATLTSRGIAFVDPSMAFRDVGFAATHFTHDGHWSAPGHYLAAEHIAEWFKKQSTPDN